MGGEYSKTVGAGRGFSYGSVRSSFDEYSSVDNYVRRVSLGEVDIYSKGFLKASKEMQRIEYNLGEFVFRQGEMGEAIYLIVFGEVVLTAHGENGMAEQVLRVCGGNDVLAIHEMIYQSKFQVSAKVTTEKAVLLTLNAKLYNSIKDQEFARPLVNRINRSLDMFKVRNLSGFSNLSNLSKDDILVVAHLFQYEIVPPGTTLLREGELVKKSFFISSGKVAVTVADKYGIDINLATLSNGHQFGEDDLATSQRSGATFTTLEKTELFSIDNITLKKFMDMIPGVNKQVKTFFRVNDILATVPLFKKMGEKQKRQMIYASSSKRFAPNTVILKEGEKSDKMIYIVVKGKVNVLKGKKLIRTLGHGEYFGEIGLVKDPNAETKSKCATATVTVASEDSCRCLVISKSKFLNIVNDDPSLYAEMILRTLGKDAKLIHVLDHPDARMSFVRHCQKERSPQNAEFYTSVVEIERLQKRHRINTFLLKALKKNIEEETDARISVLKELANSIVDKFVRVGSDCEINIQGSIREEILQMVETGKYDYQMFAKARTCVYNLMGLDAFQRFKQTPAFEAVLEKVGVYK